MQQRLAEEVLNREVKASVAAACARAWDILEDRRRIMRMKPKPRDLDTATKDANKPRKPSSPSLPTLPDPKTPAPRA